MTFAEKEDWFPAGIISWSALVLAGHGPDAFGNREQQRYFSGEFAVFTLR